MGLNLQSIMKMMVGKGALNQLGEGLLEKAKEAAANKLSFGKIAESLAVEVSKDSRYAPLLQSVAQQKTPTPDSVIDAIGEFFPHAKSSPKWKMFEAMRGKTPEQASAYIQNLSKSAGIFK